MSFRRFILTPMTHSITSSARCKIDAGTATPKAFAVCTFTTSSDLLGRSTGRSEGVAPPKILLTIRGSGRYVSGRFGPYAISPPARAKSGSAETIKSCFDPGTCNLQGAGVKEPDLGNLTWLLRPHSKWHKHHRATNVTSTIKSRRLIQLPR